jgi:porin
MVLCTRNLGKMTTTAHPRRGARYLGNRWFVATIIAVNLMGETAAKVCAQVSFASVHDAEYTDSGTAASGGVSAQPPASFWNPFLQGWNRLQTQLNNRGIQFNIRYDGEVFSDISGGLRRGTTYLGNLNLQLTVDTEPLVGWPGATVFVYGLGVYGGHPSGTFVGDAQGVSNIEAPAGWRLEEAWIQQNLLGNRFSVLIGRYDLNSEFYRLQSASLFLNSSFGIGPEFSQSGLEGPSIFPNTSVGGRFAIKPIEEIVLRTAVLDGVPVDRPNGTREIFAKDDGVLVVTEAAYLYRPLGSERPRTREFRIGRNCCGTYTGKLALGAWYYSATFDDLTKVHPDGQPVRRHGSRGVYLLADWTVYQDIKHPDQQIALFGQLGIGDPRVNRFGYYSGGGLTFSGLIPGRNQDEFGIAVAAAHNSNQFIEAQRNQGMGEQRSEITFEFTYLAQFGSHLAVQPDLQFVMNPNTDPTIKNAVVFMLRFEVSF